MSCTASGLALPRPRYTFTRVGKKHMIATTPIFEFGLMLPSHTPRLGESATIGMALDATENGTSPSASSGKRTHAAPTATTHSEGVVVAGDAEASLLLELVSLPAGDPDVIRKALDELNTAYSAAGASMYQAGQAQEQAAGAGPTGSAETAGDAGKGQEDVVEADYEIVDEKK